MEELFMKQPIGFKDGTGHTKETNFKFVEKLAAKLKKER